VVFKVELGVWLTPLNSAVLNTDKFFEQDLEGVSKVTISLNGNAQDGYSFKIESQE
jgi:hypothetical protein